MAEPARQRHPEIEPEIAPRFGATRSDGESMPERGSSRNTDQAAELNQAEQQFGMTQNGGESTPEGGDLRSVAADQETNPIPFTGNGSSPSKSSKKSIVGRITRFGKRNTALTGIVGVLLTGMFGLSLLSPSLLLMQFRETLVDKFNDQLTAMDVRSTAILKKKLGKTTTKGVCTTAVSIRCKYRTLGDRHLNRLEQAGFKVNGDKDIFGRTKPTSFTYEGKEISAPEMLNEARKDPSLRSALRHGYNPKFAAFSDAIAAKVRISLGIKKSRTIKPSSDKDKMTEDLKKAASGDTGLADGQQLTPLGEDEKGNPTGYTDSEGNIYSAQEGERINGLIAEIGDRGELANSISKTAIKSSIKGALTATALGAGAVDSACTVWTLVRVAGFAAKVYGQRQLIRYAYEFIKTPDAVRANAVTPLEEQVTPEEVSFVSTILTTPNSEGKSATDSDGYRYAAYGDVFYPGKFDTSTKDKQKTGDKNIIKNETAKYVNGQIIPDNAMASIVKTISSIRGGGSSVQDIDATCGFVKSWKGQAALVGLAVVGGVVAFFSGGLSIGAGTAAALAVSAAASIAIAALTPKLMDMAKGELITGTENGNEAGNAAVSGMGGYNAHASQARALAVLNKQDAVQYNQMNEVTLADYNEVDRYERGPLDATSKNTFVGSIVNSLLPYTSKMINGSATVASTTSFVTQSLGSLISQKSNAVETKASEFEACDDPEYEGLAADPFCNIRYGMSEEALGTDPEEVLDYMESGGYIEKDSTDGAPGGINGSQYQQFIDQCVDRESSIGDSLSSGDEGDGQNCIQGRGGANETRNMMFRLFYMDVSIQEGMDSDFDATAGSTTGGSIRTASYNILGASHDMASWQERLSVAEGIIKGTSTDGTPVDVVGLQETQKIQREALLAKLGSYDIYPKNEKVQNPIIWDSTKYSLVKGGLMPNLQYFNGALEAPWVKLRVVGASGSESEFYVLNTHDPTTRPGNNGTQKRYQNALQHVEFIKSIQVDGIPIIFTGDFNSGYSLRHGTGNDTYKDVAENLTYCILTKNNLMYDAYDLAEGRPAKCPNEGNGNAIDHIFVSKEVKVTKYQRISKSGSDHDAHIADLDLGIDTGESGGVGADIDGDDYAVECGKYTSCTGECVDFVKFRLLKHGVSKYKGGSLGNGRYVVGTLGELGYKVDTTPAVHSVFSTSHTSNPAAGHTGMVSQVNADGSIVVEEYNFANPHHYGIRKISAADLKAGGYTFAHTEVDYK